MTPPVDHDSRRRRIADALLRVAATRGLHDVGLREIAREAGVSLGALQHHFAGKDELLLYTLERGGQEAEQRVRTRLAGLDSPPTPETIVREILAEILPFGTENRMSLLAHIAYLARAVHDPRLRAVTGDGMRSLRDLLAEMLRRTAEHGGLAPGRDPDTEAMTLICLADGVTNYVLLDTIPVADAQRIIDAHLATLFIAAP